MAADHAIINAIFVIDFMFVCVYLTSDNHVFKIVFYDEAMNE